MLIDENMRDLKQGKWENKGIYRTTNKMTRKSEYEDKNEQIGY